MDVDCGLLVKNIDKILAKMANESLADDDITFPQLRFMAFIYDQDDKRALLKDIETYYDVSQPTVAGIIKRMAQKGIVEVSVNERDRRHKIATLTPYGIEVMERQENFRKGLQTILLSPLSPEEQEDLIVMLRKIWDNLKGTESSPEIVLIDKE